MPLLQKNYRLIMGCLSAIALTATTASGVTVLSEKANQPGDRQSASEQVALREGQVTVTGEDGQYTGQVLVHGSVDTAWKVLTDYNHFANFFPNVAESKLLQASGNKKVFEQVNVVRVAIFSRRSRVVISTTESYPRQIAFSLVEGDVESLQGFWRIEPVAPNQVLITHQVSVDPGSSTSRSLFFSVYKNALENTLEALDREIIRRAAEG